MSGSRSSQVPSSKERCDGSRQTVLLHFTLCTEVDKCSLGFSRLRKDEIERIFSTCFSVAAKKAMDTKLCLCLMLIILGTLTVQGTIPESRTPKPSECFFDPFMPTFHNFL